MLKVRKIIKNTDGAYEGVFGRGTANFIYGGEALAQILTHQILTLRGELKNQTDFGVSWFSNENANQQKVLLDTQIKNILNNNIHVSNILSFSSNYNLQTNTYNATIKVETTDGMLELSI